jgi:hypothetical protein
VFATISPIIFKKLLKRGERSDIYLTLVCRLPQSEENLERLYQKLNLSAKTVAFISFLVILKE